MRGATIIRAPVSFVAATFAGLVFLTGCKIGPSYSRPSALGTNAIPAQFSVAASGTNGVEWARAGGATKLPGGAWWELFGDPELNRLEELAAAQNQELAAAVARLDEARASVTIARADLFPQVALNPIYTRQRSSLNDPVSGQAAGASYTYNTFTLALQAGWELDLWGRVRRETETARARLASAADDHDALRLVLQAELATDYFLLRALGAEHDLLVRSTEAFRRSLELTVNRRKGGVASDLDVSQAETQLRTTEAALPEIRLRRANLAHAVATLTGRPATGFTLAQAAMTQSATPVVPVLVPSEWLERRPDIASAEQRMAAANAQVGVAQTAFYPRVRFNGLAGFQSISASTWFDWPSRFWAVGPSLELPLFTGGRNRAQLALARATYTETVANYRQTVLAAFQEVEDQLAAQKLLDEQIAAQALALAAAQRTLAIANNRYRAGLVTYLEVAAAQSSALNIERTLVELRGQKYVAAVGLIRALGGGWERPHEGDRASAR